MFRSTLRSFLRVPKPFIRSTLLNNTPRRGFHISRPLFQEIPQIPKPKRTLKWYLKKSTKPFNTDDISAFISWFMVSNVLLILLGTTTFASLLIYTVNTVFAQEWVAKQIDNIITKNSAMTVVFENAIAPNWSSISFNKVFVSRRPKNKQSFEKGTIKDAMERTKLALTEQILVNEEDFDDGNYTQFDFTIDQINISLSFRKWLDGKGIVETVEINGMRGVVDRTHVQWDPNDDARNYLNVHQPGDFEIDSFKMHDVLFTLYQPGGFRPFQVSIFNMELPQFRKHWLYYDMLCANQCSGSYDGALFTIHKRLRTDFSYNTKSSPFQKIVRCRVDNLNVDHLNAGIEGPFGWITSGQVTMIGDILIPEGDSKFSLSDILTNIGGQFQIHKPQEMKSELFVMDLTMKLQNARAQVPFNTKELSYINNALVRPIVGYINSKRTTIPVKCRIIKNLDDFSGSWTVYDCLLMDDMQMAVYDAFAEYVADEQVRTLRLQKVAFWTLQVFLQVVLMGMGSI